MVQGQAGYIDQGDPCGFLQNVPFIAAPGQLAPTGWPTSPGKDGPGQGSSEPVPLPRLTPVVTHPWGTAGFTA